MACLPAPGRRVHDARRKFFDLCARERLGLPEHCVNNQREFCYDRRVRDGEHFRWAFRHANYMGFPVVDTDLPPIYEGYSRSRQTSGKQLV